jgi:hypothetical protein
MPLMTETRQPVANRAAKAAPPGETLHQFLLMLTASLITSLVIILAAKGFPYYSLRIEDRPFSPLHPYLRSSGTVGLKLGFLSVAMFGCLFLYPLRKRWRWLSTIGSTRRWLNFHVLFGITTPVVVTFHTGFKWHGLAGLAYWTMILVALSGFIGRYVYAKIPRSINAAALTMSDLEAQTAAAAEQLREQSSLSEQELASLLKIPSVQQVRSMSLPRVLWTLLVLDLSRPLRLGRVRRRLLPGANRLSSLGGLIASYDPGVEAVVASVRQQSRLLTAIAFLDRTQKIFHLWHVIHRPFSISFVVLAAVHICVALSVIGF